MLEARSRLQDGDQHFGPVLDELKQAIGECRGAGLNIATQLPTMNSLLLWRAPLVTVIGEEYIYIVLATAPGAKIPDEVVQGLGWSQVTECT